MLPNTSPELTEEQLQQLKQAREAIPEIRKAISRAKLAGIDMTAQETALNEQEQQISKLLRVYGKRLTGTSGA